MSDSDYITKEEISVAAYAMHDSTESLTTDECFDLALIALQATHKLYATEWWKQRYCGIAAPETECKRRPIANQKWSCDVCQFDRMSEDFRPERCPNFLSSIVAAIAAAG